MTPKPYEFCIKPRSALHEELIRNEFLDAVPFFGPYEERLSTEEKEWLAKQRFVDDHYEEMGKSETMRLRFGSYD
jgi:hypothetical protein